MFGKTVEDDSHSHVEPMIPNPKKNAPVEFSLAEVKMAIARVPGHFQQKYQLHAQNDVFNQTTFAVLEFLSLGSYVDVTASPMTDTRTDITIEVRRKIGAFDQWHEVQNANQHITKMFEALSALLPAVRQLSNPVNVDNPTSTVKFPGSWDVVKQHVQKLVTTYPGTYAVSSDGGDRMVLRRKPQTGDDVVLAKDCIIKISQTGSGENSCDVSVEATNDENRIATQGELDRNKLIMTITTNLLQKSIAPPPVAPQASAGNNTVVLVVVVIIVIAVAAFFFLKK